MNSYCAVYTDDQLFDFWMIYVIVTLSTHARTITLDIIYSKIKRFDVKTLLIPIYSSSSVMILLNILPEIALIIILLKLATFLCSNALLYKIHLLSNTTLPCSVTLDNSSVYRRYWRARNP